jgi:hypothetical protein
MVPVLTPEQVEFFRALREKYPDGMPPEEWNRVFLPQTPQPGFEEAVRLVRDLYAGESPMNAEQARQLASWCPKCRGWCVMRPEPDAPYLECDGEDCAELRRQTGGWEQAARWCNGTD